MEVVVGTVTHAKLQSNLYHCETNTQFFLLATCPQEGLPVHFYNIARAFTKVSCMEDIWVPGLVGSIHRKNMPASKAKMVIKQTS